MNHSHTAPPDYDTAELRFGRLHKIRQAEARCVEPDVGMVAVVKCYCRSHDVLTTADADQQRRPSFVFPLEAFQHLENLIGRELEGRLYTDSQRRRVRFFLDLKEHPGFQFAEAEEGRDLRSPWYDESVLKE